MRRLRRNGDDATCPQQAVGHPAIVRVLKQTRNNKRKSAKILQVDYTTLFDKMKKYEIDKDLKGE